MSEQARKTFNVKEQKAQDVLAAIQTVKPVISLIREWGKRLERYKSLAYKNQKLSEEISSIKLTISLTINESDLERQLTAILENKSSEYTESIKEETKLKSICEDLEKEINLYKEYAASFNWVDKTILKALLGLNSFEDKEEFLSMMFIFFLSKLYNNSCNLKLMQRFKGRAEYCYNPFARENGYNEMFEKLMQNKL